MATLEELKNILSDREPHEIAIDVSGISGFRTTLLEDLSQEEIDKLYQIHAPKIIISNEKEKTKVMSDILTIATDEGLHYTVWVEKKGKMVEDKWFKLNEWMMTCSTVKKLLFQCSLEELKAVHRQLCKLRDNNEKSAKKPFNKAWLRKGIKNQNLN